MAKFDIREFNYITCGKTQNTFNVAFCYTDDGMIESTVVKPQEMLKLRTTTFFGDIGEHESMSQRYATNKASFFDIDNNKIIHNLYELPKSKLKTTAVKHSSISVSTEKIDMYVPSISDDFIHIAQFDNYAYALTKMMKQDPIILSTVMNNKAGFDVSYHYSLSNDRQLTFTHPMPDEVIGGGYQTYTEMIDNQGPLSDWAISTVFSIKRDLDGIERNFIVEIPEDKRYNDYTKGYIQCDQIVAKNHLDYTYTLSVESKASFNVLSCRDYCNIGVCGGQLYLTYRDNVNYRQTSNSHTLTYNDNRETAYDESIYKYTLPKRQDKGTYSYQHVEVIDSWNRWDSAGNARHKSSLFSLKLIDTGLNESTFPQTIKDKLRQNIKNNVRSIIENMIPANTQLFDIYFDGK